MKNRNWKRIFSLVSMEFLALNTSLLIALLLTQLSTTLSPENESFLIGYLLPVLLFNLTWAVIQYYYGNSDSYLDNTYRKRMKFLVPHSFMLAGIVSLVRFFLPMTFYNQFTLLGHIFLFNIFNLILFRLWLQFHKKQKEKAANSKVLIVGGHRSWKQLPEFAERVEHYGYQVVGLLNGTPRSTVNGNRFALSGQVGDLSNVLEANPIDEIFITLSSLKEKEIKHAIQTADYHGVRVNLVPETPNFLSVQFKPSIFEGLPVIKLRRSPLDEFKNYAVKRLFDIFFSSMVLLALLPVFALIAFFIYIEDHGPIFYKPIRKGEKGAVFKCYKFRTMSVCDDPVNGQKSTEKNDPRISRVGKFIRKRDIDELPQFFNVLKGDMSVVGPRPHRVFLHNDFREIVNEYMVRHYVKPGISGWAQVNGWRGPTKTVEQKRERVQHDLWYIQHWSFWLDLKIIYLTLFGKKTRQNAF